MTIQFFISSYIILSIIQITRADIYVYDYSSTKVLETIEDEDSTDGPKFSAGGLKGYLIQTNPTDACQPIDPPPSTEYPGYQWIALIRRSTPQEATCHFTQKIINAHNANFSAVIIYNYEDALLSMSLIDANTFIPATFITNSDGLNLIRHYLFNLSLSARNMSKYYVKIVPSTYIVNWSSYVIPFIAIIAMSFLCLLGFILSRWCIERRRNRRHRLPRSALKQLQVKKFVKTDPWEVCAICLDDFEEGAKLRILPCQHAYHMKCIDPWLINNRRQCPCCKRYVFPNLDNSDDEHDGQRQTPTERTPLITTVEENSSNVLPTDRHVSDQQTVHQLTTTGTLFVDSSDEEKDDFSSSIPTRTTTTTDSRQYGSFNGSISTARAANFYVGSTSYTTDNSNVCGRSIIEDTTDTISNNANDEQTHRIEHNQAFVNDEQSTNTNQTYL